MKRKHWCKFAQESRQWGSCKGLNFNISHLKNESTLQTESKNMFVIFLAQKIKELRVSTKNTWF